MKAHGIAPIDLLVVNLYPFEATVDKGAGFEECIENIDIGGPAMIRAAAKNHDDVAVVVEAQDYQAVLDELAANKGATTLTLRRRLAAKAYARTAAYDAAISNWFARELEDRRAGFPRLRRPADPGAALRREPAPDRRRSIARPTSAPASPPRGSCRARNCPTTTSTTPMRPMNASPSSTPTRTAACVIVKHANPCGVAEGADLVSAYRKALACEPDVRLWRHHRAQPHARCRRRARHHRNLHRSHHRARCRPKRRSPSSRAKKNLRLLLAGGLPDPRARGPDREDGRRRLAGAEPRQRRGRRHDAEDRDQARADRCRAARSADSRSASPSTSSPTPSSMPRISPPSASAPAR